MEPFISRIAPERSFATLEPGINELRAHDSRFGPIHNGAMY